MRLILTICAMLALATCANADAISYLSARTQFSGNVGYLWVTPNSSAQTWQGPDVGAVLTVSLHQQFSVYGSYEHGFPMGGSSGQQNIVRIAGSYKAWPPLGVENANAVFVSAGRGWFGRENIRGIRSTDAGVVVSHELNKDAALAFAWSHAFADDGVGDFDFVKACVNLH